MKKLRCDALTHTTMSTDKFGKQALIRSENILRRGRGLYTVINNDSNRQFFKT